ncbi:MAG: hypothetical protein WKG00_14125 [Polyangiaceae bacterium]
MMALAAVADAAEATHAVAAGARGVLVVPARATELAGAGGQGWAATLQVIDGVLAAVPRGTLVVAHVEGADAELLRALRGVDAAVPPPCTARKGSPRCSPSSRVSPAASERGVWARGLTRGRRGAGSGAGRRPRRRPRREGAHAARSRS